MYRVKDYKFETEQEAKEAQSELRAVDYLRTKINMDEPEAALEIFKQLLDQDIFHTIVGYDFLKSLQNFLRTSASVDNAAIPQIPDSLAQSVLPKLPKSEPKPEPKAAPVKKPAVEPIPLSQLTPVPKLNEMAHEQEAAAAKEEKKEKEKTSRPKKGKALRIKKDRTKVLEGSDKYRTLAYTFGATTVILLIAVIIMFALTLTSDNPTILDYETKLINKYAAWEAELSEKETELKSREADITFREEAIRSQTFAPVDTMSQAAGEEPQEEAAGQTDEDNGQDADNGE